MIRNLSASRSTDFLPTRVFRMFSTMESIRCCVKLRWIALRCLCCVKGAFELGGPLPLGDRSLLAIHSVLLVSLPCYSIASRIIVKERRTSAPVLNQISESRPLQSFCKSSSVAGLAEAHPNNASRSFGLRGSGPAHRGTSRIPPSLRAPGALPVWKHVARYSNCSGTFMVATSLFAGKPRLRGNAVNSDSRAGSECHA